MRTMNIEKQIWPPGGHLVSDQKKYRHWIHWIHHTANHICGSETNTLSTILDEIWAEILNVRENLAVGRPS